MLFCGVWYPAGLCSAGSDTPQDFVKWGIRPCRALFWGVSGPAEQVYAIKCAQLCHCSAGSDTPQVLVLRGSDTPQGLVLRGLIPRRILFCGVSDPAGKLRPRRTRRKSFESLPLSLKGPFSKIACMYKLHYPRHIGSMLKEPPFWKFFLCFTGSDTPQNFKTWISPRIRTRIRKYFRVWIRGHMGSIHEKKPGAKNIVLLYL